ncbi:ATP-binding protein [Ideonella sp.]|uniref:ATP-binding protein n=1 Tax=Ideonella sp. TaxID=1929293 RepID=UPI0037BFABB3
MNPLTDEDLLALLGDLESDRVERKQAWSGSVADKAREAICAFANDLPGHGLPGVLFLGASDDGQALSQPLDISDELLRTLADIKSDGRIVPQPTMTVERRVLQGQAVAVVCVWPADAPPVRYNGRIWVRTGPRRDLASAQDERILNERRRHRDQPFDLRPVPGASMADLSLSLFAEDYLPQAFAPDVLAANERSMEQRLSACRMVDSADTLCPTVLGALCLGRQPTRLLPGAYVQFLRIQGREWGDAVEDEALLDGPLPQLAARLDDKLASHNRVKVEFTSQTVEQRHYLYPPAALQQVTRNALMHRTYEATHAPVRVYWFDDRIEVMSPGGPFGLVTVSNFGQAGVTDYRNPHLAEAMKVFGLVQRFGVGLSLAQKALRENGNPPLRFEVSAQMVRVTLFAALAQG